MHCIRFNCIIIIRQVLSTFIDNVLLNKDNDHKAKAADQHHSIGHKVFDAFKTSGTEL